MKTILWKELRDHARWVPLGGLPMVAVLLTTWWQRSLVFNQARGLMFMVAIVASCIAAVLGLLQCWPDQRPAARALLLHRGITAEAAFRGKLVAGLMMYAVAVFLPLLMLALYMKVVGIESRAADPRALLPSAWIAVACFCFWPAGFLILLRDASIFGSRLLPAVSALLMTFVAGALLTVLPWFGIGLLLLVSAIFIFVARAVFTSRRDAVIGVGRAGLAAIVIISLLNAVFFVGSVLEVTRRTHAMATDPRYASEGFRSVEIGPDGWPWLTVSEATWTTNETVPTRAAKLTLGESVRDELRPVDDDWHKPAQWSSRKARDFARGGFAARFHSLGSAPVADSSAISAKRYWVFDSQEQQVLIYRPVGVRWRLEKRLLVPSDAASFGELVFSSGHSGEVVGFTLLCTRGVFRVPADGSEIQTIYQFPASSQPVSFHNQRWFSQDNHDLALLVRLDDRIVLLESALALDVATVSESLGTFAGYDEVFKTEITLPSDLGAESTIHFARDPTNAETYVAMVKRGRLTATEVEWFRFGKGGELVDRKNVRRRSLSNRHVQ